ncbi:hypothetical protein CORC01_02640 [Colletotrichum orchidophilum]|uniref:Integral membrane protein n=1 Tax=Colletotrichum orchidophilum TaxID=1209926 RepID=A0A1G4BKU2_9PEZI|nr:uncharacterized protein CORC01_02640 [Colletotrichum orchidophilum]OHF02061.1 hypothetical protein CORC01_02640 [Colletotrichum orchidophilum]
MESKLPSTTFRAIASLVVLFFLATTFLGLRIYARVTALRSWRLRTDDYVLFAAWVLFTGMIFLRVALLSASTFAGILTVPKYSRISGAAGVMSNMAWALSKTSFVFTLLRLMTGKLRWMLWFIIFSMNLFIVLWLPLFLSPCVPGGSGPCWPRETTVPFGIFVCDTLSNLFIWESAETSATIMAASIPVLRKLALNVTMGHSSHESSEATMLSVFQRQLRIAGISADDDNQHADQPTNHTGASSANCARA